MGDTHPPLTRREAEVLQVLRVLHAEVQDPAGAFDQEAVEVFSGPAAGSLDTLVRYGLARRWGGKRSRYAFGLTPAGVVESMRGSGSMISVPRAIGGQG
jgi:hypothetical protein